MVQRKPYGYEVSLTSSVLSKTRPCAYTVITSAQIYSLKIPRFMHERSISTYNITMYENTSKPATYHMHISPPATTLPTVSPNHSHAHSFKALLRAWECLATFQLEGGCWNTSGILVCKSERSMIFYLFYFYYFRPIRRYMGPCGHRPAPQLFDSYQRAQLR